MKKIIKEEIKNYKMKKIKRSNYKKNILNYMRKPNKKEKMQSKLEKIKSNKLCLDTLIL